MVQKHLQWLDGEWLYWGPEFIAKACTKIQGQVTSGANSIAQRATITAVDADPSVLQHMVDAFHSRRDLVVGLLKEIPE
jgi:aspartate aminotransferase